jgi:hypothetical protein
VTEVNDTATAAEVNKKSKTVNLEESRRISQYIPAVRQRHGSHRTSKNLQFTHLLCSLCRQLMTEDRKPRLLECGHSMCDECVKQMPVFQQTKEFKDVSWTSSVVPERKFSLFNIFQKEPDTSCCNETTSVETVDESEQDVHQGYGYILCLGCRDKTFMKQFGCDSLPINKEIEVEALQVVKRMSICAECELSATGKYCENCSMYLCNSCCSRLHSGLSTSKHSILEMGEISPSQTGTEAMVYS